jgi:hypothetical protein
MTTATIRKVLAQKVDLCIVCRATALPPTLRCAQCRTLTTHVYRHVRCFVLISIMWAVHWVLLGKVVPVIATVLVTNDWYYDPFAMLYIKGLGIAGWAIIPFLLFVLVLPFASRLRRYLVAAHAACERLIMMGSFVFLLFAIDMLVTVIVLWSRHAITFSVQP